MSCFYVYQRSQSNNFILFCEVNGIEIKVEALSKIANHSGTRTTKGTWISWSQKQVDYYSKNY